MTAPAAPSSLTHQHLLAAVLATVRAGAHRLPPGRPVRVLDAGCGTAAMLAYFAATLPRLAPDLSWEFYGYDVSDSGVQPAGYFDDALARLHAAAPGEPWAERLALVRAADPLPWAADSFAVVVSNQVGEHVEEVDRWFREQQRVLAPGGAAVHLFPVKSYVWEGHLFIPFAHRIRSHDLAVAYIRAALRAGLSFRQDGGPLNWSAESHADYLLYNTYYRTGRELLDAAKRARLRASFRFTGEFYAAKVRQLLGRPPRLVYRTRRSAVRDALAYHVCKYLAGVTLVLEKRNAYRAPDAEPAAHAGLPAVLAGRAEMGAVPAAPAAPPA